MMEGEPFWCDELASIDDVQDVPDDKQLSCPICYISFGRAGKEAFDLFAHHLDEVSLDLDVAPVTCLRRSEFFCRARTSQAPTSFLGYL